MRFWHTRLRICILCVTSRFFVLIKHNKKFFFIERRCWNLLQNLYYITLTKYRKMLLRESKIYLRILWRTNFFKLITNIHRHILWTATCNAEINQQSAITLFFLLDHSRRHIIFSELELAKKKPCHSLKEELTKKLLKSGRNTSQLKYGWNIFFFCAFTRKRWQANDHFFVLMWLIFRVKEISLDPDIYEQKFTL